MNRQKHLQRDPGQKWPWPRTMLAFWHRTYAAVLLLGSALILGNNARAQAPIISYPVAAQSLTVGYSQANLTVKIVFNGACTGATTVKVALPAAVAYVAGSVTKTAGTAALGITESSITDLGNPVFNVSGIAATGDNITFTVARRASCGALATAKDSVYVFTSGGCSNGSELSGTVNTYNILAPSLAITPPAAINNTVVGATATRTTTVTNGGNGVLDTLRFYIVYTGGAMVNTSGTNAITANGSSFTPVSTSGDTLFYKIYGPTLFGGDNLLSNGETVTITEPVKIAKCTPTGTACGAGWGRTQPTQSQCQIATATSTVTIASGAPAINISFSDVTTMGACPSAPGILKITYTNTGSGGAAGNLYNIAARFDYSNGGNFLLTGVGEYISNVSFGAVPGSGPVFIADTLGTAIHALLSQFTADPDGAGVGLDDLDGDGQYDDLAPGKSFTISFKRNYIPSSVCPRPSFNNNILSDLTGTNMCGTSVTNISSGGNTYQFSPNSANTSISTLPQVLGNTGFPVTIAFQGNMPNVVNQSVDSIELTLTLPTGVTYVPGSLQFHGVALADAANVTISGATVQLRAKNNFNNNGQLWDFTFNLINNCSGPSPVSLSWEMDYVNTRNCGNIIERVYCSSYSIPAVCGNGSGGGFGTCPGGGMANIATSAARTSLGFTDSTLTTRINPASISSLQLATVMPYDTIVVTNSAMETAPAFGNLHFNFEQDKANNQNTLQFIGGTYYYKPAGSSTITSVAAPAPTDLSTGTHTQWDWNLTGLGGVPATLQNGDSVWVVLKYVVTNANNTNLYGNTPLYAPNAGSYFYSNNAGNAKQFCTNLIPLIRYVGVSPGSIQYVTGNGSAILAGCNSGWMHLLYASGYGPNYRIYNKEFRPKQYIDSVVIILPAGVSYDSTVAPKMLYNGWTDPYTMTAPSFAIAPPVINGQRLTFINPGGANAWLPSDMGSQWDYFVDYHYKLNCVAGNTATSLPYSAVYYGKNFYYDNPGVSMNNTAYNINITVDATQRPTLTSQNNSGIVQGILPQQYWDVQINNPSTQTAPYVWLSLSKGAGSGGISIDSVVLKPSNVRLTSNTYNGTDHWYPVSTSMNSGSNQQARVYFKYTTCHLDSLQMQAGWNCTGYPSPDPLTGCSSASQAIALSLKADPQASQVQLSVARQPGGGSSINLCTTDSALLIVNSAQAADLVNPYVIFYPPAGVTMSPTIKVEYPLGSGNYQNAAISAVAGGGYKIDLTAHTAIGTNGILGTALANPAFTPLGGDRQVKIKLDFTTSCGFVSGSSFNFNVYGSQPCGAPALGNGTSATTNAVNITGATAAGGAGVLINLGGDSVVSCGSSITVSNSIIPTGIPSVAGDTMVYTLPAGLAYAGNLTAGFTAVVVNKVVKVALPAGVPSGTPINFGFNVTAMGSDCGGGSISGAYQRSIPPLSCGGTPCSSSSVVMANGTSSAITLNKPSLNITSMNVSGWIIGVTNTVQLTYANAGTMAYTANTDSVEFFCGSSTTPFAVRPLTKNIAIGASDSSTYSILIPSTGCSIGDLVTAKIQTTTNAGTTQCLCASSSYLLTGVALPLTFTSIDATVDNCAVGINWSYNLGDGSELQHFVIERSSDGASFNPVATLTAVTERYMDIVPQSGKWYYRIKAVGISGHLTYSKTIMVVTSRCVGTDIKVYPNPVHDQVQIVLQGSSLSNNYELVDMLGQVLQTGKLQSNANNTVDVSRIASGTYMLKVWMDGVLQNKQISIVR